MLRNVEAYRRGSSLNVRKHSHTLVPIARMCEQCILKVDGSLRGMLCASAAFDESLRMCCSFCLQHLTSTSLLCMSYLS